MQSPVVYMTTLNIIMVLFQKKNTKPGLNNMVLVAIDSFKGSLQTASRPSRICTATFLFFNLPYVCNHNSDKS